jgi:L-threonylcarbamoyladenylate synthase
MAACVFDLEELGLEACAGALAEALVSGGLAVFPTDTVYGLAASVLHPAALRGIFDLKGREAAKSLVVMVQGAEAAEGLVSEQALPALRRLAPFWPGALTIVAPRRPSLRWAEEVAPGRSTLGLRVPDHPLALALTSAAGPLAVTSANLSGMPAPRLFEEVPSMLLEEARAACRSRVPGSGSPSTIVEIGPCGLKLLRPGPVDFDLVESRWLGG